MMCYDVLICLLFIPLFHLGLGIKFRNMFFVTAMNCESALHLHDFRHRRPTYSSEFFVSIASKDSSTKKSSEIVMWLSERDSKLTNNWQIGRGCKG